MPAWETTREKKMTGIDPERLERRQRWAAEQLGLRPDASLDEVRAAWLRRLPAEEFVPSSELRWALAALLRRPSEGGWEARADEAASATEADRLRGEVEAFAEQFWDYPGEERRRRWEELSEHCAFAPSLRARLRLLEVGLEDVPIPNKGEEENHTIELASHLRELFVLRPRSRTCARHALLLLMEADKEQWIHAVGRLRHAYPKLAALGNDLLDKITTAAPMPKSLPKKPPPQPTADESEGGLSGRFIWIIVVIVVGLCRAACNVNKPTPRVNPSHPQFDSRHFQPGQGKEHQPTALEQYLGGQITIEELKERMKNIEVEQKNRGRPRKVQAGTESDKPVGKSP